MEKNEDDEWDQATIIPLIDGGTEGFKGQSRVVLPRLTSCLECSLSLHPDDPLNFQLCTLANRPRQPEHCIAYVLNQWQDNKYEEWKGVKLDKDDPNHMTWIFEKAKLRAEEFKITGLTFKLTQAVVKRIIPAIASTNAIISAVCVNEALKIATQSANYLKNYMSYSGASGVYTNTFEYAINSQCPVCKSVPISIDVDKNFTLQEFVESLKKDSRFQLTSPSLSVGTESSFRNLILQGAVGMRATASNLSKTLGELLEPEQVITVTDPALAYGVNLFLIVSFKN